MSEGNPLRSAILGETAVNIHRIECPSCSHNFYVHVPQEDGVEETDCVECGVLIEREYSFEETEEQIEVEIDIREVEQDE